MGGVFALSENKRIRRTNTLAAEAEGTVYARESLDMEAAVSTFISECRARNLAPLTIIYYRDMLSDLTKVLAKLEITRPIDVKKAHMSDVIRDKREGRSDATVNKYIRGWRAFFNYICGEGYIKESPFARLREVKSERRLVQAFSDAQVKTLLAVPNRSSFTGYRDYIILMTLLDTGIRVSELEGLRLTGIYWKERQLKVFGKGRKERLVPFSAMLKKHLEDYVNHRGLLDHDFLFVNIDNLPFKKRGIQQAISDIGKLSKVRGVRVSAHTFRHTFAKMYIVNGGDAFSLQKILGHTTLDMVRTYVSMFGTDLAIQHAKYSPLENLSK